MGGCYFFSAKAALIPFVPKRLRFKPMQLFIGTSEAARRFGISAFTLKTMRIGFRQTPASLVEGVHWIRPSARKVLFNAALLEDFLINRGNPEAHDRAIAAYLASLPSSKAAA
jgi:hypothetical protein